MKGIRHIKSGAGPLQSLRESRRCYTVVAKTGFLGRKGKKKPNEKTAGKRGGVEPGGIGLGALTYPICFHFEKEW